MDARGRARMVDVGAKDETERVARAEACVIMARETLAVIEDDAVPKGDVIAVARLAGIMAAKRTDELIPLCHQLNLNSVAVQIEPDTALPGLRIVAEAKSTGRTGVEMEALVAVVGRGAHGLRHVQGHRQTHGSDRGPLAREERGSQRGMAALGGRRRCAAR